MNAKDLNSSPISVLITESQFAQLFREYLERERVLDVCHRVQKLLDGTVALPVLGEKLTEQHLQELRESLPPEKTCTLTWVQNPIPSKAARVQSPAWKLCRELQHLVSASGGRWSDELEDDLPRSWQRHGDLILLSEDRFRAALWKELGPELWETVASALGARRIAKRGRISPDGVRSPTVTLLLGQDGWVEHVDNGIRYTFDVTRCMFSPGNITEKLRVASLPCAGEVLVDLYAGIGYFTVPYLIHAGAAFVHACEWNPHAVEALRKNLELNGVQDRCQIHQGDNRQLELRDVANRVNLGLLPSSEEGWPIACQLLRKGTGGILHIHQNVESFPAKAHLHSGHLEEQQLQQCPEQAVSNRQEDKMGHRSPKDADIMDSGRETQAAATRAEWQRWAETTGMRIRVLLQQLHGRPWRTNILHIEPVKSYAPHVYHIVLDLECRPLS
ncbi:tRNA wybutosine-synthesizing protein 2 homolog isoform X2 [Gopherus evgoodei]|uniref:tRNA wybutosine-synthesizing protein 2 homolog n=2 Tax=Gopherus evgoodei TaxID=1825980 RepID=A0A8C4WU34_9SAUR|nr:tRNA wybutosine-synthesizing protein 2 homolog isoform X2 [Gopherus evgoodei]XP_030430164.1 tRNA wybutosine-synthesizing protein 2 homolog isoform X2 [Gopherus evgoodei]